MKKKKVYVLMVSRVFPKTHPRSGQPTYFKEQILHGQNLDAGIFLSTQRRGLGTTITNGKITTIRGNYDLWAKRAEKINRGEAVLSLRQWSGDPYKSKQKEFMQLTKIGVQRVMIVVQKDVYHAATKPVPTLMRIKIGEHRGSIPIAPRYKVPEENMAFARTVCTNDGLNDYDFKWWFPDSMDGVIIHFTNFRY